MKIAVHVAAIGLCGALLGTSVADDKPAETKPAEAKPAKAPDPHFVEPGEFFYLIYPDNYQKKGSINFGYMTDGTIEHEGAKLFRNTFNEVSHSKKWFKTRVAKPEELYVGRRVIYPPGEIKTRYDLEQMTRWHYGYIANISNLAKGTVMIADQSQNPAEIKNGIRVIVGGDPDPKIELTGKEDAHYFHPEHWLIYTGKKAPDADGHDAKMALAIVPPAKPGEEGTFFRLDIGDIVKTKYAHKSRPATKADLKAGLVIAISERGEVPDRERAYWSSWWVGPLTSYDNGIAKLGNGTVRVEHLRVIQ